MYFNIGYEVKILKYDLGLRFPHFLLYIRRNHIGSLKVPFFPSGYLAWCSALIRQALASLLSKKITSMMGAPCNTLFMRCLEYLADSELVNKN